MVLAVLAAWALRARVPLLSNLEGQVINVQQRLRGPLAPGPDPGIVILLVDDRSIAEIGRIPISRAVMAQAIERLVADGAGEVAIDMLFADPSRDDPAEDDALALALSQAGNVTLPFALTGEPGHRGAVPEPVQDSAFMRYDNLERLDLMALRPAGLVAPLPRFAEAAARLGNVGVLRGYDGSLRFDVPAQWFREELYPTLALRVAARALHLPWERVEVSVGDSIRLGGQRLPLDAVSRQWVNYYGPEGSFPTHSFADYVAGRVDPRAVRGHIVLIGGSALGASDRYPSPFDPSLPGVERMATVIDNLITGRWLARPPWAALAEILGIVLLPFGATLLIRRQRPGPAMLMLVALGALTIAIAQGLFVLRHQFVSVAFPLAALVLSSGLGIALRARMDERFRRDAEGRLRASELRYALSAQGANDGLWDLDLAAGELYCSPRWRELMGIPESASPARLEEWIGRLDLLERERFQRELDAHLQDQTRQFHLLHRYDREGEERWILVRGVAVRAAGTAVRMAGSITDLTDQKRLERQIAFDSIHDRLTGLPNRNLFLDRLQQLMRAPIEGEPVQVGILMVDVDGYLAIERAHGQFACNALVKGVAGRLEGLGELVHLLAHMGGDQFALAYLGPEDRELASLVAHMFDVPYDLAGVSQRVTATISAAHSTQRLDSAADLLGAATLALSAGKRSGPGTIQFFDPSSQEVENSRRWLAENIRAALDDGEQFELFYQPFVRLSDRRLLGFEALIRWQHPERGMVMPGDFIPFAEESGLINEIGRWTLREAAQRLADWDRKGFDGEIAVNLSSRQFTETDLEADGREVLRILGPIAPARFKFEVTESMSMSNPQRTTEVLQKLAAMGFKISIDDFGTGYSSLAYLHRFPFDTLKIDRSFVIRLGSGREAQEIVRTIAGLAAALGKQVLAEGVEDEEQARTLRQLGAKIGQGWLFARPLPVARALQWFAGPTPERPSR